MTNENKQTNSNTKKENAHARDPRLSNRRAHHCRHNDPDGYAAWTNFLGYAPDMETDDITPEIENVIDQMPEDEIRGYLDYYGIE